MVKRKHKQAIQSPLMRRLLMFWLPFFLLFVVMVYLSQLRYNAEKEAKSGLDRINMWRVQAGVQPLRHSPELQKSARQHALYLTKDAQGHDETNRSNPYFSGEHPQARATAAGYPAIISENLTISNWARSGRSSADGLMTALYHRLSLLNPEHDEAGAAWARGRNQAFVINQGSSYDRELCERSGSLKGQKRYVLTTYCDDKKVEIALDNLPPVYREPVVYPIGNGIEPAYDGKEQPNPMPNGKKTGNPVSIAFYASNAKVEMISFRLFAPDGEIHATTLLTAQNDPNRLLTSNQFALFANKPLAFDTDYRVEFVYYENGQKQVKTWTFHTRKKRSWLEF